MSTFPGLTFLGAVPNDEGIVQCDLDSIGLFDLSSDSPALAVVKTMVAEVAPALKSAVSA